MERENVDLYDGYLKDIKESLLKAQASAHAMQTMLQTTEGDTDLFRKLAYYMTPNLHHWLNGLQAGGIKDIEATLHPVPEKKKK